MKKVIIIIISLILIVGVSIGLFFLGRKLSDKTFKLNEKYYVSSTYFSLDKDTLDTLIKNKESFVIFVYQPMCAASSALEDVIDEFMANNLISFYKISFSDMKETVLKDTVTYYPSVVIYKEGEVVDYLDANSGEDVDIYKDLDAFDEWLTSYVKVEKKKKDVEEANTEVKIDYDYKIPTKIKDLTYSEDKINVYFFWGDGCPHCAQLHTFFDEIEPLYGDLYDLHEFEVWYSQENATTMFEFSKKMGVEVDGIPTLFIGEKVFVGFGEEYKQQIVDAIVNQHKNSFDPYFTFKEDKEK